MIKVEQINSAKNRKKHIPFSATLIASVLFAVGPKEQVIAQEIEEDHSENEIKILYTKYHSLLNQFDEEEQHSEENDSESTVELSTDEIKEIQEQLLILVEEQGNIELVEKLQEEVLTGDELHELFNDLIDSPTLEDQSVEEEESLELEEIIEKETIADEVEEETEITEEVEEIEEVEEPVEVETPEEIEEQVDATESVEIAEPIEEKESVTTEEPAVPAAKPATLSLKPSAKKSVSYTVRAGDTLNKIANQHNVTVNHIAQLNNIRNVNVISVGQKLMIHGTANETTNSSSSGLENLDRPASNQEFIEILGRHAAIAAQEKNLYASVMIAQAALETGYGTSTLSSAPNYNLYGMKGSYQGQSVVMRTREYSSSRGWYYVNDPFKKYPSYLESLLDHAEYIRVGPTWAKDFYYGVWRENTTSYRDATSWLQGRYATDPAYASKLNQIIERYNLTRFDSGSNEDIVAKPPVNEKKPDGNVKPSTSEQEPDNSGLTTYRVKRGDTLSHIGRAYNMSVQELKTLNNLQSDLILVNQVLKVKGSVAESKPTPPTTSSRPAETNTNSYTVKRGDTLSHIGRIYNISVQELKTLNNLQSDLILVNQVLKVKGSVAESKPTPSTTPSRPAETNTNSYTVKSGDTLSHIGRAYNMSVQELKTLNNLQSDLILVNQVLKVKGSVAESKPTSPTTPSRPAETNTNSYTVKRADTLSHIGRIYNISVQELKTLNNLQSDLILVNQVLKVKGSVAESKPTPPTTSSKPVVTKQNIYKVKRGDTLYGIAGSHKTTVAQLKQLNFLQSDLIFVGQELKVNRSERSNTTVNTKSYQIKAGDTLSHIARTFNTTVKELKAKNNLTSDLIYINQRINL